MKDEAPLCRKHTQSKIRVKQASFVAYYIALKFTISLNVVRAQKMSSLNDSHFGELSSYTVLL